ncbi:hypothetical protein [Pseudolabrys taiwanensis]|uniref:hypothetical protein n=1 Tax=Pseudolabrys taiwanensis TaxID=331696 RepID=UPI001AECBE4D|nr:hypothetical protein [Pseudolabrys taiwanensis]
MRALASVAWRGVTLLSLSLVVVFALGGASLPVAAADQIALPPLGVWRDDKGRTDMVFDLKTDRNPSAADMQGGLPLIRKEPLVPFVGLSLTRPLGGQK